MLSKSIILYLKKSLYFDIYKFLKFFFLLMLSLLIKLYILKFVYYKNGSFMF